MADSGYGSPPPSTTFRGGIPRQYPSRSPIRSFVTPDTPQAPSGIPPTTRGNYSYFRLIEGSGARSAPTRDRPNYTPKTAYST